MPPAKSLEAFPYFYSPGSTIASPETLIHKAFRRRQATRGWRVHKDKTEFGESILITALHDATGEVVDFPK
jgi:hypothetical protein